jgi:hypothetical protein
MTPSLASAAYAFRIIINSVCSATNRLNSVNSREITGFMPLGTNRRD